jgi:alkylation response protein AidB-like acyl-CoA dehydrogenase
MECALTACGPIPVALARRGVTVSLPVPTEDAMSANHEDFRVRVRAVTQQFVPPSWKGLGAVARDERPELLARWRAVLQEERLLGLSWPTQYGGAGLGVREESVLPEECVRAGLPAHPHPNDPFSFGLLGPTLLRWGTEAQKQYFLPRSISGEIHWAQGYSEPEAGSDLFALRTRAVRHGDEWIINGQKIWQTAGVTANWTFALDGGAPYPVVNHRAMTSR